VARFDAGQTIMYGPHNIGVWPPTNIGRGRGRGQAIPTFSWLYMPMIYAAAGLGHLLPIAIPPAHIVEWAHNVELLAEVMASNGIDAAWLEAHQDHGPGGMHISAADQEYILELNMHVGQWALSLAMSAVNDRANPRASRRGQQSDDGHES